MRSTDKTNGNVLSIITNGSSQTYSGLHRQQKPHFYPPSVWEAGVIVRVQVRERRMCTLKRIYDFGMTVLNYFTSTAAPCGLSQDLAHERHG